MNKQRASSVIQMCVYFQEQQKKSDLPNNLNFESHTSTFVQTWKHHEAVLLLSNVELLIQTLSPASVIVAHASPGPAPPLKLPNTRTPLLFLLPIASQLMPRSWTLLDVADSCLLPGSSGGLSLLDKCVKTWNTEHQVSCFFVNKVLFK